MSRNRENDVAFFNSVLGGTPDLEHYSRNLDFFNSLKIKWESIALLLPAAPRPQIVFMELLGIDSRGRNFASVIRQAEDLGIPPDLPRLAFLVAAFSGIEDMLSKLRNYKGINADAMRFNVNLDHELLNSPHLHQTLKRRLNPTLIAQTLFEVNEQCLESDVPKIKELISDFKIKVVLDDGDKMAEDVRRDLADSFTMAKLDALTTLRLMPGRWKNPRATVEALLRYRIENLPFVIEGIEDDEALHFIRTNCGGPNMLLGQGYEIKPEPPFNQILKELVPHVWVLR